MVEGARLESVYTGNCIEGSNPSLSALLSAMANFKCWHTKGLENPGKFLSLLKYQTLSHQSLQTSNFWCIFA